MRIDTQNGVIGISNEVIASVAGKAAAACGDWRLEINGKGGIGSLKYKDKEIIRSNGEALVT